jgi:outer membrane lipoprotein SlyB
LVGGAIAGSLLGGIGSKITGHDGGKGALLGAIVGGLAGHHKKEKKKKQHGQRGYDSSDSD